MRGSRVLQPHENTHPAKTPRTAWALRRAASVAQRQRTAAPDRQRHMPDTIIRACTAISAGCRRSATAGREPRPGSATPRIGSDRKRLYLLAIPLKCVGPDRLRPRLAIAPLPLVPPCLVGAAPVGYRLFKPAHGSATVRDRERERVSMASQGVGPKYGHRRGASDDLPRDIAATEGPRGTARPSQGSVRPLLEMELPIPETAVVTLGVPFPSPAQGDRPCPAFRAVGIRLLLWRRRFRATSRQLLARLAERAARAAALRQGARRDEGQA
jgi:hypothetical protein